MPRSSADGSVLLVGNHDSGVGFAWWLMEHYWATIAGEVAGQGRRCLLAYPRVTTIPRVVEEAPLDVIEFDWESRRSGGWEKLSALVREHRVTGMYLTDRRYWDSTYAKLRRLGVRFLAIHDHTPGSRPEVRGPKGWTKRLVHRWGGWSADLYVATTEFVQQRMVANAGVPLQRTVVVRNGILPAIWTEGDRDWARREIGAMEGEPVVGLVARAHPVKNIDFAIRCASELSRNRPDLPLRWVYVGDGPAMAELKSLASSLDVSDRFVFLGQRGDARRLMAGMDIGFHPSDREVGYCLSILEFMDAGLGVVVPDEPSVSGASEHGVTGLLYSPGDPAAACAAIARLADDPVFREAIGQQARSAVTTHFSIEQSTRELIRCVAGRL